MPDSVPHRCIPHVFLYYEELNGVHCTSQCIGSPSTHVPSPEVVQQMNRHNVMSLPA